jgi:hypothetical protein
MKIIHPFPCNRLSIILFMIAAICVFKPSAARGQTSGPNVDVCDDEFTLDAYGDPIEYMDCITGDSSGIDANVDVMVEGGGWNEDFNTYAAQVDARVKLYDNGVLVADSGDHQWNSPGAEVDVSPTNVGHTYYMSSFANYCYDPTGQDNASYCWWNGDEALDLSFGYVTVTAAILLPSSGANIPYPFAATPTAYQQQALQNMTSEQSQTIQNVITPLLQQAIQSHPSAPMANFRSWQDIIGNSSPQGELSALAVANSTYNSSPTSRTIQFSNDFGPPLSTSATIRKGGNLPTAVAQANVDTYQSNYRPAPYDPDQDGDGLPDNEVGGGPGDLEDAVAEAFTPDYYISAGEQQQFAAFGNYVPWTVTSLLGTSPIASIPHHVSPLGLVTDSSGNQLFAIRVDYLSLWNADGGLVGGGAACFYSYFGLDNVINQVSGHELDAERSVMLLAAPAVNGGYNPDASAYSLYSIYTAAHEGTFFDQSEYADFSPPVPAGNHVYLAQSVSKHSTYGFNPDFYPITPDWLIADTLEGITDAYAYGDIDDITYAILIGMADDTFYGCLVERFGYQGNAVPGIGFNVGEVSHPLGGHGYIQDDSARALNLSDKLTNPVF